MGEFHILQWDFGFDGPWSEAVEIRYREGGYDGLSMTGATSVVGDLDFLRALDGLRVLSINAQVRDDAVAFLIASLEKLSVVTGSKARLPDAVQPALRELVMSYRPEIEVASRWPGLESFRLGMARNVDLQMLGGARKLAQVRVEGRRQEGSLDGIEECSSLEELIIVDYSVAGTVPLRGLNMLSELRLMAAPPSGPHKNIDLSDIADSRLRKLWISNASAIRNMEMLLEMQFLRNVRLIGCNLEPADRRVLDLLPPRVKIDIL